MGTARAVHDAAPREANSAGTRSFIATAVSDGNLLNPGSIAVAVRNATARSGTDGAVARLKRPAALRSIARPRGPLAGTAVSAEDRP